MGSRDPWEQLSALEKKAGKRASNDRLASADNGSACAASEVSTSGTGESGENFQVDTRTSAMKELGVSLWTDHALQTADRYMSALPDSSFHLAILFWLGPGLSALGRAPCRAMEPNINPKSYMQVVIRVRPPLQRELEGYQPFQNTALVDPGQRKLTVSENAQSIQNGAAASDIALVSTAGACSFLDMMTPAFP